MSMGTLKLEIDDLPNKVLTPEEQRFQSNTENIRLSEYNPQFVALHSERIVYEWYKSTYGAESVSVVNSSSNIRIDFLVTMNNSKRIGVNVKSRSVDGFRKMRNQIVHGVDLENFIPTSFVYFEGYHLVIVLRNYDGEIEFSTSHKLAKALNNINPLIQLKLGFINDSNYFETIYPF